jgi:uncharacterized protein (TIGR02246 family)
MKFPLIIAVIILAASSTIGVAASDSPESINAAWKKAVLAGDIEAVVALYANDAVGWFPGTASAKGKDAIRQAYVGLLKGNNISAVEFTDTQSHLCGDMAVLWGSFTMTVTPKSGGAATKSTGRFTEVLKHDGGKWLFAVDHASENSAPPPTP